MQVGRQDVIAYLQFLKGLGWTHLPESTTNFSRIAVADVERSPAEELIADNGFEPLTAAETLVTPPPPPPTTLTTPATLLGSSAERLQAREADLQSCARCKLCPQLNRAANRLVYGVGNPEASLIFVGEGPGEEEDKQGEPFVGRAGELLTKIIGAMGYQRGDVYICNVVKHRPPGNRDPEPDEIAACEPFLIEQLEIIRPQVLVTLGNHATRTLLRTKQGITSMRGRWQEYHGIPVMPTYHPSYVLRNYTKQTREQVWSDMQAVIERLKAA